MAVLAACSVTLREVEIRITFDEPAHADLVGRATIAAKLAGIEGMDRERALELAGLS